MVLEATALGISSYILARGEKTFSNPEGEKILQDWNIPDNMIARCFVILGYADGPYPPETTERGTLHDNRIEV